MLSGAISKAGEGEAPRGQSVLSSTAGDVDIEEGEVVCPTVGKVANGKEGL